MKSMRIVFVALITVFAISAVASSAASAAEPEWLLSKKAVTTSTPVTLSEGTLEVTDFDSLLGKMGLICSVSGKGTVAAKGEGSITELKLTKCKKPQTSACEAETKEEESKKWVTAVNLPWKTQLSGEGETFMTIHNETGFHVGFQFECKTVVGQEKDECTVGTIWSRLANNVWGVLGEFNPLWGKLPSCTQSKKATGENFGTLKIKGPEGQVLSFS